MNLNHEELDHFFTEVGGMIRAGQALGEEWEPWTAPGQRRLNRLARRIQPALARGEPLSKALAGQCRQITPATLALIQAGEESDTLAETLDGIARSHRRLVTVQHCVRIALIYPTIIFLLAVGLLSLLVMPWLRDQLTLQLRLLEQLGAELPSLTIFAIRATQRSPLIQLSFMLDTPTRIGIAFALVVAVLWTLRTGIWSHPWLMRFGVRWIPGLGGLASLGASVQWCHSVGDLLARRVPLDRALLLAEPTLALPEMRRVATEVRRHVERGNALSSALMHHPLLPRRCVPLILRAESTGSLDRTLIRTAEHLNALLDHRTQRYTSWLEPAVMLFTGLAVFAFIMLLFGPLILQLFGTYLSVFTIPRLIR
ncbi:type II secretion system F family protein [Candidatus Sumerlaeota bacterium]|nr:type II secretion system F family protein [Candidatus Sumerlaeota bacterium]